MKAEEKTMDKVIALAKGRGFIFPGSEIYGGLANTWDYGPLGVEFKNNVKKAWWKKFVQENKYNVGVENCPRPPRWSTAATQPCPSPSSSPFRKVQLDREGCQRQACTRYCPAHPPT